MTDSDSDGLIQDGTYRPDPRDRVMRGPFVAVRHRAAGSGSVYFGPFATWADLRAWMETITFGVQIVPLVDPHSPPDTWWC